MNVIKNFTIHNGLGESVLYAFFSGNAECTFLGPITKFSWQVNGVDYEKINPRNDSWEILPDNSGFMCYESGDREFQPDNCVILDVYGNARMRLTVPWQLTGETDTRFGNSPTSFSHGSGPYRNPATGELGKYGVKALVARRTFYFELDYHTGEFLWSFWLQRG